MVVQAVRRALPEDSITGQVTAPTEVVVSGAPHLPQKLLKVGPQRAAPKNVLAAVVDEASARPVAVATAVAIVAGFPVEAVALAAEADTAVVVEDVVSEDVGSLLLQ